MFFAVMSLFFMLFFNGCEAVSPAEPEEIGVPEQAPGEDKDDIINPINAFGKRKGFSCVEFAGKLILAGGWDGSYRYSDVWEFDGAEWIALSENGGFSGRTGHSSFVFNNAVWITGGYDGGLKNDVWFSGDGKNWINASENAEFTPRSGHTTVVHNGVIWLIGGGDAYSSEGFDDIWWSVNGKNWIKAADLPFTAGIGHKSLVYKDEIWVIGVEPAGAAYKNYVYKSGNGKDWERVSDNAGLGLSFIGSAFVYEDKIWTAGNMCTASGRAGSVIYSSPDGKKWTEHNIPGDKYICGGTLVNYKDEIVSIGGDVR